VYTCFLRTDGFGRDVPYFILTLFVKSMGLPTTRLGCVIMSKPVMELPARSQSPADALNEKTGGPFTAPPAEVDRPINGAAKGIFAP
jgi:hypothetical protein